MAANLRICQGLERGMQYALEEGRTAHVGRGSTCEIRLSDPIASRYHAVFYFEDGDWHVRDTSSRNGTEVNGQKIDQARLDHTTAIRIGDTEMVLETADPTDDELLDTKTLQLADIDVDRTMNPDDPELLARRGVAPPEQLLDLYSLSLSMMRGEDPSRVVATVLELVHDRTGADIAAVSLIIDGEPPRLSRSLPEGCEKDLQLTKTAINRVASKQELVWFRDNGDASSSAVRKRFHCDQYNESIFVPMVHGDRCIGVMHLYRRTGSFDEAHVDLAVAACRLASAGLRQSESHVTLKTQLQRQQDKNATTDELVGDDESMMRLKQRIRRVGPAGGCVLIRGESGSGKELVARAVHRSSGRARRPMLTVNCAAIPANLIESQLFGHVKGSFTGADRDHAGWFSQANGGTLFLDEIGELPLEGQAKLLRILEGHPFLPVGGTDQRRVDVRVIVATHRDLAAAVREGKFREDLFYRLSVFELEVPPLRDRGKDLERLIQHFFEHFRGQHGRPKLQLSDDALARMLEYPWPGNVRQLRNVVDSAVVMADDPEIVVGDLGLRDAGTSRLETLRIDVWEERLIRKALEKTDGSVPGAAKLLGISRATAYRKIQDYEIQR